MSGDILSITSVDLKNGKFKQILPEFYDLKSIIENNRWHLHQSVFDHVIKVVQGLEQILEFDFLSNSRKKLK